MRLINVSTRQLEEFFDLDIPRYSILSHTWGREEVSYLEYNNTVYSETIPDEGTHGYRSSKQGFWKIEQACRQSERFGLRYTWVDTCCIDKNSSADLSEAINSMFTWYEASVHCYVYLEDVHIELADDDMPDLSRLASIVRSDAAPPHVTKQLAQSRWFTRGWTLQELIAPRSVLFFDKTWAPIGDRQDYAKNIAVITGIEEAVLCRWRHFSDYSIATRMSWAADRETARREDIAYCLLGLFSINMPLLYGEGHKAFLRLQEEIMQQDNDTSILAWRDTKSDAGQLLAPHPDRFRVWRRQSRCYKFHPLGHRMVSTGLHIELPIVRSICPGYCLADLFVRHSSSDRSREHGLDVDVEDDENSFLWLKQSGDDRRCKSYIVAAPPGRPRFEPDLSLASGDPEKVAAETVVIARAAGRSSFHSAYTTTYTLRISEDVAPPLGQVPLISPKSTTIEHVQSSSTSLVSFNIEMAEDGLSYAAVKLNIKPDIADKMSLQPGEELVIVFGEVERMDTNSSILGIVKTAPRDDHWLPRAATMAHEDPMAYQCFPNCEGPNAAPAMCGLFVSRGEGLSSTEISVALMPMLSQARLPTRTRLPRTDLSGNGIA